MAARRKEKEEKKWGSFFLQLAAIIIAVVLIRSFVIGTIYVKGSSMEPNFHHGDFLIINKLEMMISDPEQGDIVICSLHENGYDENIIKRVIGVPGDVIDFQENDGYYEVYVNGEKLKEDYIAEPMLSKGDWNYPMEVPEGSFFVMGDNRNASSDSRKDIIGPVSKEDILGKVVLRVYPFSGFGLIR